MNYVLFLMIFTFPHSASAAGFVCHGNLLVAGGTAGSTGPSFVYYDSNAKCNAAISTAHEGFICKGKQLVGNRMGIGPDFDSPEKCLAGVAAAHEGFICKGPLLLAGGTAGGIGPSAVYYEGAAKCQAAVDSAHEGFVCKGKDLISNQAGTSAPSYDSPEKCQAAVALAGGSNSSSAARASLSSCLAQLKDAQAHDPTGNDDATKAQYQAVTNLIKKLEKDESQPAK